MHVKWEERKNAFIELKNWVLAQNSSKVSNDVCNILIKFTRFKLKDFKENNINILKEAIELFNVIVDLPVFNKKLSNFMVNRLVDTVSSCSGCRTVITDFGCCLVVGEFDAAQ